MVLPATDGPTHAYLASSAACWELFGELLAKEFGDPAYFSVHQLTVDTYAVQHPGEPERRTIQSLGLHLMTLCLFLERGFDIAQGPAAHKRIVENPPSWVWLDPPENMGSMTVADVVKAQSAEEHRDLVWEWARSVWQAWARHHETVRRWVDRTYN